MGRALGMDAYLSRMARDPGGSGRMHHEVGIRCRKCAKEEWATAPQPGWGRRIFKTKGWDCGNGLNRHTCPDCVSGKTRLPATQRKHAREVVEQQQVATVHHLPEPERPIIHVHQAPEPETPTMTAIAAAMQIAVTPKPSRSTTKGSRGRPFGFSIEGNAAAAARKLLVCDGVANPQRDIHYKTHRSSDGTWSYEIVSKKAYAGPATTRLIRQRNTEGKPIARRDNCVRAAQIALSRMGIANPMADVHYTVTGSPGVGYVYRLLDAAQPPKPVDDTPQPSRLTGGGFLSRYDARKDALAVLQAARKTGGAPAEGVDYWITQDGYNLWGWRTTNPNPANQDQAERANPETKVATVQPITDEPRAPTRIENRRIMETLDECYDADRQRYKSSFSDQALAVRLDVPRAWVSKVREEFYGPEANEAEIEARRQKLALLDAGVDKAAQAIAKSSTLLDVLAELETLVAELRAVRDQVKG